MHRKRLAAVIGLAAASLLSLSACGYVPGASGRQAAAPAPVVPPVQTASPAVPSAPAAPAVVRSLPAAEPVAAFGRHSDSDPGAGSGRDVRADPGAGTREHGAAARPGDAARLGSARFGQP